MSKTVISVYFNHNVVVLKPIIKEKVQRIIKKFNGTSNDYDVRSVLEFEVTFENEYLPLRIIKEEVLKVLDEKGIVVDVYEI